MKDIITLSHGSGGEKSDEIIKGMILPSLGNSELNNLGDGAILNLNGQVTFSTDSFVINPIFFNGGDIGKLAVCGTCNDLLMCGSIPKYLSLALIIEEGFGLSKLQRIIWSIKEAAIRSNVTVVTGDTKVVEKGHGDGIFINTAGIGIKVDGLSLGRDKIKIGDKVIITGDIGDHGISIMCERNEFFESSVKSDCEYLYSLISIAYEYREKIKILRDPTRGGVATTLNEFVDGMDFSIEINEDKLPFNDIAKGASEILGIDLLYSANEGKAIIIADSSIADELVNRLRKVEIGKKANVIGEVVDYERGKVLLKGQLGGRRILSKLASNLFPRIC